MPILFGASAKALVLNTTLSHNGSTKLVLDLPVVTGADVSTEQYFYVNDYRYLWSACLRLSGGKLYWDTGSTVGTGTKTSYVKTYVYNGLTIAANTFYHITVAFDYANGCDSPVLAVGGAVYTGTASGTRAASTTLGGTQFAIGGRISVQPYSLIVDYYVNDKPFLGTILEVGNAYVANPTSSDLQIISGDGRVNALGRYFGDAYYWSLNQLPVGDAVSTENIIRPNADVSIPVGWVKTPSNNTYFYQCIDEVTLDTADHVSRGLVASDSIEFGMSAFTKIGVCGLCKVSLQVSGLVSVTHELKNIGTSVNWALTSNLATSRNFISIQNFTQTDIDNITWYLLYTGGGKASGLTIYQQYITMYDHKYPLYGVQHVYGTSGTYFVGEPGATGAPMTNLIGGN